MRSPFQDDEWPLLATFLEGIDPATGNDRLNDAIEELGAKSPALALSMAMGLLKGLLTDIQVLNPDVMAALRRRLASLEAS